MRLWTIHPSHLDARGLVALWREGLLAQAVLRGRTKGYKSHPQLDRFRAQKRPVAAIAQYLRGVCDEADARGYRFDRSKIARASGAGKVRETQGQLLYEWAHLKAKLRRRSPAVYRTVAKIKRPRAHPMFVMVKGGVREWERQGVTSPGSRPVPSRRL